MKPHAFVVMPFGDKKNASGKMIDFNVTYRDLIKPALEEAGFEVLRADEEMRGGEIRTDMFQELLIADMVVADLTIENANVWYEVGVRHALRARGVVLLFGQLAAGDKPPSAFNLYTDRKVSYGLKQVVRGGGAGNGEKPKLAVDPDTLEKDKAKLTTMVKTTMESWHGHKVSPVYHLLPNLQEPDWKSLRVGTVREFWERHDVWEAKISLARKAKHVGDVLVLADEAPVAAFRADAWVSAGEELRKAGHFEFALEQIEKGLVLEPTHLKGLQQKGICLQRLAVTKKADHSLDKARQHYGAALVQYPNDAETWALLGRVDKDEWEKSWTDESVPSEHWRSEAAKEEALLRNAIGSYERGFRADPRHFYSGGNVLTLMALHRHLTATDRYSTHMVATIAGAVRFAAESAQIVRDDFWCRVTLGDVEVLTGTAKSTRVAYKEAIAINDKDWFALNSSRTQLVLLQKLGFRPETVNVGIETFDDALRKLTKPLAQAEPAKVILFSGHMIDTVGRPNPRFPDAKTGSAAQSIASALDEIGIGPGDLVLTQGANGGDLLFTEACLERGARVQWLQPFAEPKFIEQSVAPGGPAWRERYFRAKTKVLESGSIAAAPDRLGSPPKGVDVYERCNLWLLYTALSYGIDKVSFLCLWNGQGGDGPGGTAHMYNQVKARTGRVTHIDPATL